MICDRCEKSNWDGIVPDANILFFLESRGIKPTLNAKGWIDIPA
jgi:hypothetical protein